MKYTHETWSSPWKSSKLVQHTHRQDQNQCSVGKVSRLGRYELVYCCGPCVYGFRWSCQEFKTLAMATWFWGLNGDLVCGWVHWRVFVCICDFKRFSQHHIKHRDWFSYEMFSFSKEIHASDWLISFQMGSTKCLPENPWMVGVILFSNSWFLALKQDVW